MELTLEPLPKIINICEFATIRDAIAATPQRGLVWFNPHTNLYCTSGLRHEYTEARHLCELANGTEAVSDLRLVAYAFAGVWCEWARSAAS
jgi:hypothetical protein